ncbi:MAG: Mu transposase C-terminal domain-containing protein, partial [Rhodoferax sp.]|nr:Mu transposase C-terminal domain-containing protein [Rhodoferax sp.]
LPTSERRCRDKLAALGVPARARAGKSGGGLEYDGAALPAEARAALAARQVTQAGAQALVVTEPEQAFAPPALPGSPTPPALPDKPMRRPPSQADKDVADARVLLVNMVHELGPVHGVKRACATVALQLASGQAPDALVATARQANQRARGDLVSARTLERWLALHREHGWWGLLPAPSEPLPLAAIEDDVAAVLGLYHSRDPQWRNLSNAAKEVTRRLRRDFDSWTALYARCRRALEKVDNVSLIKARHSGAQRAARLPFKRRDTSVLAPLDVWVIDGHTFKAKVRHPDHGAPFAPELTLVLDAATRMICGWSVSLSENVFAVGDALRHAIGQHGVPAIVYTDNGAGETAKAMDCPVHGFMARLGIDHRTGIPGHPQGHGIIERSWQTHAINCARQFGSYQGSDADAGTFRKVAAELAKEQRAIKRTEQTGEVVRLSPKAPTWRQFIHAVERMVADYNGAHRHRRLPKRADGRHQTPAEAWAGQLDPALQHRPGQLELRMLFMPAVQRTAQRGQVTLFNQAYQAPELMQMGVDGAKVSVRYDIHDPNTVQIYDLAGAYVCEARWDANRIDYFPKPVVQIAREKRVQAAVKRRQQQIDTALRELQPPVAAQPLFLPEPDAPEVLVPRVVERHDSPSLPQEVSTTVEVAQAASGRPSFFDAASDRYEWLMRHQGDWTDDDATWLRQYAASDEYESLGEYYAGRGLAWPQEADGEGFRSAR